MDHLGSTRVVLNGSGTVVSQIDNAPFGERIAVTGLDSRKQFIDKEKDGETGTANHGVRQYDPERGSFTSLDVAWEKFPSQSPYHYSHNNPVNRLDGNGLWDIEVHVSKDREENGFGIAILRDRKGDEVFRWVVRVEGRHGHDRTEFGNDTPLGVYDIPDGKGKWRNDGSRQAYGPNHRLVLNEMGGEIVESGRTEIRMHGGRQEGKDEPKLEKTLGCIRTYDDTMKQLKETTDRLEAADPKEKGGILVVIDDLVKVGSTYVPAHEQADERALQAP